MKRILFVTLITGFQNSLAQKVSKTSTLKITSNHVRMENCQKIKMQLFFFNENQLTLTSNSIIKEVSKFPYEQLINNRAKNSFTQIT